MEKYFLKCENDRSGSQINEEIFTWTWYKKISHWNDNDDSDLYKNLKTFLNPRYEQL